MIIAEIYIWRNYNEQITVNYQIHMIYLGGKIKFLYYQTYPGLIFTATLLITLALYLQMNH